VLRTAVVTVLADASPSRRTATLLGDGFADTVVVVDLATEALEVLYLG
jgi:hypothetical protein